MFVLFGGIICLLVVFLGFYKKFIVSFDSFKKLVLVFWKIEEFVIMLFIFLKIFKFILKGLIKKVDIGLVRFIKFMFLKNFVFLVV